MSRPTDAGRGLLGLLLLAVMIVLVALPTVAAEPSGSAPASAEPGVTAAPTTTAAPDQTDAAKPDRPAKQPKGAKAPGNDVTITGTIATRTNADGDTEYTMIVGGKPLVLAGGPPWFYGNDHPLQAYVGKRVTITGTRRVGQDQVDVETVNGTRLRAAGKPPWAGGWKRVGERHPGWTQEKWNRWQTKAAERAKRFGTECFPPGQCKEEPN